MTSMLEYLASLRRYGHQPTRIGEAIIGRTHYAAGEFVSAFDDHPTRIALVPMYRSDWVTRDSAGPKPNLLPASYLRSSNTVYQDRDTVWYVSGWHTETDVLWLDRLPSGDVDRFGAIVKPVSVHWGESFETAMALAGPEVRTRIAFGNAEAKVI